MHYWRLDSDMPGQKIKSGLFENPQHLPEKQIYVTSALINYCIDTEEAEHPQKHGKNQKAANKCEHEAGKKLFHYFSTSMITFLTLA